MARGKTFLLIKPRFSLSVLDRYLSIELALPLIFGIAAFSSIGLAIGSLFDIVNRITESGLSLEIALIILMYKMPEFVSYSFPMSTLLATLTAYGRLSADSELIALRSVGLNIYRLVLPAIIISFIVTGVTFLFNESIVPIANYQADVTLENALLEEDKPDHKQENIFYQEFRDIEEPQGDGRSVLSRLFYAEEFDGQEMRQIIVIDRSQGNISQIISAESGAWNFRENRWDFHNGIIYITDPQGGYRNIIRFEHQQLQLPRTPIDIANSNKSADQMNIPELQDLIEITEKSGDSTRARRLTVRLYQKTALPFICVAFALVGSALGMRPQNQSKATSFGLSILIIFSYYLMGFITGALGISGFIPPFWAAWLPNFFGLGAGIMLLNQAAK